ncbi:MAG TPA: hypothetical protein VFT57_16120 [Gemmatimonadaceae bacterium]|nr:hypothetical protein [Gemmatimonadaceae bacterium]
MYSPPPMMNAPGMAMVSAMCEARWSATLFWPWVRAKFAAGRSILAAPSVASAAPAA